MIKNSIINSNKDKTKINYIFSIESWLMLNEFCQKSFMTHYLFKEGKTTLEIEKLFHLESCFIYLSSIEVIISDISYRSVINLQLSFRPLQY